MKRIWTAEDDVLLTRLYDHDLSDTDISKQLDRTCQAVVSRRRRLGLFDCNLRRAARRKFGDSPSRSLASILDEVSERTGVHKRDIRGTCRFKEIVQARQEFMFEAYASGRYSFPKIGGFLNMHHTTVMHGVRRHSERVGQNIHIPSTDFSVSAAILSIDALAKQSTVSA